MHPLLSRARAGDAAALNQLLEALRPSLYALPGRTVPDQARARLDTSDLIQDSLLEAAQSFGQFQGGSVQELVAWLRAIVRHNNLDAMRRLGVSFTAASTPKAKYRIQPLLPPLFPPDKPAWRDLY